MAFFLWREWSCLFFFFCTLSCCFLFFFFFAFFQWKQKRGDTRIYVDKRKNISLPWRESFCLDAARDTASTHGCTHLPYQHCHSVRVYQCSCTCSNIPIVFLFFFYSSSLHPLHQRRVKDGVDLGLHSRKYHNTLHSMTSPFLRLFRTMSHICDFGGGGVGESPALPPPTQHFFTTRFGKYTTPCVKERHLKLMKKKKKKKKKK